jgi:3-hydroxyacyl-CoA dehydrogenase
MRTTLSMLVEAANQGGNTPIRKVAVCGAGVMGAQIAAHCVNAGIPVVLYDLAAPEGDKSGIARRAIAQLSKMNPAPLGSSQLADAIVPANYNDDLAMLGQCDLVIEAIAERLDWKRSLYENIAPALKPDAIIASNTSGLSIGELSRSLPEALRPRYCGVHFFNPPRYMELVELIPTPDTDRALLDQLETFLVSQLGKGVVRARDTPNFIGNRIGVFSILSAFIHAENFGLPVDLVDELTGTRLGRAKSGTFRTADIVGLDTLAHVIGTMQEQLRDDSFHAHFGVPAVVSALIAQGALGQKTGAGFYRKEGRNILRLDPAAREYVPADPRIDDQVADILARRKSEPALWLKQLHELNHPQAQFLWSILRDSFHYSAVHLAQIADNARQVDLAMRRGFGHAQGPFEIWQSAGWRDVVDWINQDIAAGKTLSSEPLPDWATRGPVWDVNGVQTITGSWNPREKRFEGRSRLPVYRRQIGMPLLVGEPASLEDTDVGSTTSSSSRQVDRSLASSRPASYIGTTVYEDEAIRCWTLPAPHPSEVLIVSFNTRMHTLSPAVVRGLTQAVDLAETSYRALVIGQLEDPFSAGADLKAIAPLFEQGGVAAIEPLQREMQDMVWRLRYAQVPVVAALAGLVLGGGCELAVHCAHRVAHFETYMGLVEAGIGLVPGAGGLAYCARRAAERQALTAPDAPLLAFVKNFALTVATARVSKSALDAREIGFLRESDAIVMNRYELFHVATRQALAMAETGWRPPLARKFPVAGRDGIATLKAQLVNMKEGGFISEHDCVVGEHIAHVICGGDVEPQALVDEAWLLAREREAFLSLLGQSKTQERIMGFLKTGKPVRN